MKPLGPERDREIAELRGDRLYTAWNKIWHVVGYMADYSDEQLNQVYADHEERTKEDIADGHGAMGWNPPCCFKYIKPYSTSIATAMELWEEMKGAKLMPTLKTIWIEEGELGYRVSCEGGHFMHETWDMCDAISGAWLKWKEQS